MTYHILDTALVHKEFGNMIAILVLMLVSLNCVHGKWNMLKKFLENKIDTKT